MSASLLTVEQLQARYPSSLDSDTLQDLIDAAERDITRWAGPFTLSGATPVPDDVTEVLRVSGSSVLRLLQEPSEVISVDEDDEDLAVTDDYLVVGDTLVRVDARWGRMVTVEYTPVDSWAARRVAAAKLVALELNYQPGLASQTIGDWSEVYNTSSVTSRYDDERYAILSTVRESSGIS